ncbi:MMPL family transporter [Nocardia sp. NBC_00565]|uniref:MMPL family transporter n=1 Tax=Nocardia sp. NBC_00565 TaxID=2975993 RepID=UPI002E801F37|nr:MMPL family transporter [Nocardia sp. NBC_00565]WUC07032.1 MMPL family transporter [Nocardia sp. NBC_00565]
MFELTKLTNSSDRQAVATLTISSDLQAVATRRSKWILGIFAGLALVMGMLSSTLFDKVQGGGYSDPGGEASRATEILRDTFGAAPPNFVLLVRTDGSVDDPESASAAVELAQTLKDEPSVAGVTSYWMDKSPALRSDDGKSGLIVASILGEEGDVDQRVGGLADRYGGAHGPVEVRVGGYAMLLHETVKQSEKDAVVGESIAFPITLIALLFVFGGLVAASLPLVVAAVTVMITMGALYLITLVTDLAATATNVATLLGLGLAIDYSLLIISRYRDELAAGAQTGPAVAATMRSAGRTVAFSAVTVAVAISGLLFFPLLAVRSIGYAGLAVAVIAATVSLTVLPAILRLLGSRIDRGQLGWFFRPQRPAPGEGFWHRLAVFVMRKPMPIGLAVTAFLLLLGTPFLGVKLGFPDERALPESMNNRQITEIIQRDFAATDTNGLFVVLPDGKSGLDAYARKLSEVDNVGRVDTATGSYAHGGQLAPPMTQHAHFETQDAAYLSVTPDTSDPGLLDRVAKDLRAVPAPSPALVGGIAAASADSLDAVTSALPLALAYVVIVMLIVLFLLTGSVVLPLVAIVLSALSLTATFGALVWIFQDGHLSGLLDFTVTGDLPPTVPVMLFGVAFGLAMDYQVFLLSRILEEYERTGKNEAAVAHGLEKIGRIVTAAAVLISLVFLGFLASDITFMKSFGIGLPLAVLVDATLVRGFLLPAVMKLLGDWNWWAPGPLEKLHERFGFDEGPSGPALPDLDDLRRPARV